MTHHYALFASAHLHDVQIDEVSVQAGEPLEVGPSGQLHLPVPEGTAFVARGAWLGHDTVEVVDGRGEVWRIGPDDDLSIQLGPLRLDLRVVRQFALRRTYPIAWRLNIAWLVAVMALTVAGAQLDLLYAKRCEWFGIDCAQPMDVPGSWNAEYLARLLREDYDGREDGEIVSKPPEEGKQAPSVWLPAGAPEGPKTELGGAEQVAPEPVRTPPDPVETLPPKKKKVDPEPLVAEDVGTPIVPEAQPTPVDDGVVAVEDGVETEAPPDEPPQPAEEPPAEEEEGFGLADWMDTRPEEREIDLMLRVAKYRLRIDPDDPDALSLLAYYQYLAEDFEGAEVTYDKLIEVQPEDAAAYNNKALIYKRRAAYDKEEGLYRVALALEPDDTTALNNLAVNLAHQKRFDEALAIMEQLETLLPGDPYSDLHRAKIHAEMGNDDLALEFLDQALAGMAALDTLHHIEFRQDIRIDPSFSTIREDRRFRAILRKYYGSDTPVPE